MSETIKYWSARRKRYIETYCLAEVSAQDFAALPQAEQDALLARETCLQCTCDVPGLIMCDYHGARE